MLCISRAASAMLGTSASRPTSSSNHCSNRSRVKRAAVVERRFELQPLPQLRAADLGRRRILHQIVERHRALPAEPGGEILDADADILARAGFGRGRPREASASRRGRGRARASSTAGWAAIAAKASAATGTSAGCATQVPSWPLPTSRSLSARTLSSAACVRGLVALDRDEGRHAAHREGAAAVAGRDQPQRVSGEEGLIHGHQRAVGGQPVGRAAAAA